MYQLARRNGSNRMHPCSTGYFSAAVCAQEAITRDNVTIQVDAGILKASTAAVSRGALGHGGVPGVGTPARVGLD